MPLTPGRQVEIQTIEILSVASIATHTFVMGRDESQQILWSQTLYTADAVVGGRRPLLVVRDENANLIVSILYFQTINASGSAQVLFSQGNTIIPQSVLGAQTALPSDLFVRNGWTLTISDFVGVSAGDVISGWFQVRT